MCHFFVRQERQELEDRLSVIESKQRQLEAQDRLISEALSSTSYTSITEPVTEKLKGANKSHLSDEVPHHVSGPKSGYYEYHEHDGHIQLSSGSVIDVTSSRPVSVLPSSSYSRMDVEQIVPSAVSSSSKPGVENGLPAVSEHVRTSADNEVDSHTARIREYHNELLQRQTDRQHALLEARRRLQMRAEQLLDSGLHLLSDSPSNKQGALNCSQLLTVPFAQSRVYEMENYGLSGLSGGDVSHVENSNMLQTQVDITKSYKPEMYQPKPVSEEVEGFDDDDDTDDERQFVTPELKEDGRVRPCRVAEYSPSPTTHANDAVNQQTSVSPDHSNVQSNKDDFNSLILQAQRDLAVRQQQMQDQLEALENEERRLAEQQLRISSQLGSFPPKIQTFSGMIHSQQPTDPCMSSSSDQLAVVSDTVYPSLPAQNTSTVSCDKTHLELFVTKDSRDVSRLRSDQKGKMAVDNTSSQTISHHVYTSHSAPQLQSCDHSVIPVTTEQLLPSGQLSVSTV